MPMWRDLGGTVMTVKEIFKQLNFDYEELLYRFSGNEGLAERFLKKFLEDKSFQNLSEAKEKNDYMGMESAAHTLKGVAGNLGLKSLYVINQELVAALRAKEYHKISDLYDKSEEAYKTIIKKLEQL